MQANRDALEPGPPRPPERRAPPRKPRQHLPALAFVGILVMVQNLAIQQDAAPDPFLRPALSVTQAFRIPPEASALTAADFAPAEFETADFAEADFGQEEPPTSPSFEDLEAAPPAPRVGHAPAPAAALDPIAAAISQANGSPAPAPAPVTFSPPIPVAPAPPAPEVAAAPPVRVLPPPAALPAPDVAAAPVAPTRHRVAPGESLWAIARKYSVSVRDLRSANPQLGGVLRVGADLRLPGAPISRPSPPAQVASTPPPATRSVPGQGLVYTVRSGDTLSRIAKRFQLPMSRLILANELTDIHNLRPGDILRLEAPDHIVHRARNGDSLWSIAELYDMTVAELVAANGLGSQTLQPGQELKIPVAGLDAEHFETLVRRRDEASKTFITPVHGRHTDGFGMRTHPIYGRRIPHRGLDIAAHTGTPIRASRKGVVTFSGWLEGYGKVIVVKHAGGWSTRYAHCSKLSKKKGQRVKKGEKIAEVGSTGLATAPHVHFEVRKHGVPQDPLRHI